MMSLDRMPSEFVVGGVYFSPLLFATLLGMIFAWVLARLLNRLELARFFWWPSLAFHALWTICTVLIGAALIPF